MAVAGRTTVGRTQVVEYRILVVAFLVAGRTTAAGREVVVAVGGPIADRMMIVEREVAVGYHSPVAGGILVVGIPLVVVAAEGIPVAAGGILEQVNIVSSIRDR